jgi:hypothetical protein
MLANLEEVIIRPGRLVIRGMLALFLPAAEINADRRRRA